MERWRHGAAFGALNGRCRVHRAEILRVTGTCAEAEREALAACEELRPWLRREFGWPLVELGNIRLRKGDLDGAEEAFLSAHEHSWSPQPGLALLRLAQGDVMAALSLIADAIEHPVDMPSKELPPFGALRLAPLLDAQAEIAAYAEDPATATRAAEALAEIAVRFPSSGLAAATRVARARCALLSGDLPTAIDEAMAGVAAWVEVGAPYETAGARLLLGRAYEAAGHVDRAAMEWQSAHAAFRAFGAAGRVSEVEGLLSGRTAPVRASRTEREGAVAMFLRSGGSRTVAFRGRSVVLPDLKGFRYLDRLLAEPGRELHVCDMVAGEHGTTAAAESGLPVLDDEAKAAYRRRLADIDEDIEEATLMNDLGRLELAERDRDYLVAELARAAGIGGRDRTLGGSAERARTSVARSLRYAIQRLAEHDEVLAGYLTLTIRTGTYCSYAPDPVAAVAWELSTEPDVRTAPR
jgi:tetratricopeptide (TPR) repeat protein